MIKWKYTFNVIYGVVDDFVMLVELVIPQREACHKKCFSVEEQPIKALLKR